MDRTTVKILANDKTTYIRVEVIESTLPVGGANVSGGHCAPTKI
jgi:hypothetical protein